MAHSPLKAPPYGAREPLSAWARRFTIAARTAKRWAAAGQIPGAQKVGQRWYVRRSKAADRFGARFRRQPWSIEDLTEWDRSVALSGMDVLPLSPDRILKSSIFDSREFLVAVVDLVTSPLAETYTFGQLMEDARFLKVADLLSEIFPRKEKRDIAAALLNACFDYEFFDSTKDVSEMERRATERRRQGLPRNPALYRDLHLADTKAKERSFNVSVFAKVLGLSRAAVYKAFKKKGILRPAAAFRRAQISGEIKQVSEDEECLE
jgi:hypothetical protein